MCDGGPDIRDSLASSQGAGPRGRDEQQRASETWAAMSRILCVVVSWPKVIAYFTRGQALHWKPSFWSIALFFSS